MKVKAGTPKKGICSLSLKRFVLKNLPFNKNKIQLHATFLVFPIHCVCFVFFFKPNAKRVKFKVKV